MLKLRRISASHRDAFLERYEGLHGWALQMTANDRALAEDLLHDLFILFTLSAPELSRIQNLDNYLYTSLRNLHISQLRRTTRGRFEQLEMVEYESARLSLRSIAHGRDLIQAQDELRRICHYACARKATANSASVLILRFFHGYYPSEIAKVMRSTRNAVDVRLRAARIEAKAYLENSGSLAMIDGSTEPAPPKVLPTRLARTANDFLLELQQTVFDSRQGDCLNRERLKDLYEAGHQGPIARKHLAHIVSCPVCLDAVNSLLGLPLLAERYPTDTMDKDNKKGGPPDDGGKGGAVRRLDEWEREAREAFEHKPQELCVSVNGYLLGSQLIGSELSELTLNVAADERISFCEVFSEQGIRLMMMNVEDSPPNGPGELRQRVSLSEARTLESSLLFSNPFPTLHVTYHDPALAVEAKEEVESHIKAEVPSPKSKVQSQSGEPITNQNEARLHAEKRTGLLKRVRTLWPNFGRWTLDVGLLLRPATITAVFAVLLVAVLTLLWSSKPAAPVTAADLLHRAAQAEDVAIARPDTVIHRTFQIEERSGSLDGKVLTTQRVELWQSAAKGVTARRVYDSSGRLVRGEWTRSDNVTTLYSHGVRPQIEIRNPQSAIRNSNIWQLSPSAKDFSAIVGEPQNLRLEERANHYILTFESGSASAAQKLVKATLVIGRDDLHAIEQTLVLEEQRSEIRGQKSDENNPQLTNQFRYYRISETSFERRPLNAVAPAVFEPESELVEGDAGTRGRGDTESLSASPDPPVSASVLATPELEVEVLRLLNGAGGDLSDQVNVTRTSDGRLHIDGTVETASRKAEILRALSSVANHPAVKISVETVTEAEQRQRQSSTGIPKTIELQQVQIAKAALPIEPELRRYFADRRLSSEQLDQEITKFASRIMRRSLQTRLYARTLKQTVNRFSPDDLRALNPESRQKLMALIHEQATNLHRELSALRNDLQAVVPGGGPAVEQMEISSDADLLRAINRLGELVFQSDEAVRASFSLSSEGSGAALVKDASFWRSLKSAEALARKLSVP